MNTFTSLCPLKGSLYGVWKLDSLLTFEEYGDAKTNSATLELWAWFKTGLSEVFSRHSELGLKVGKHVLFGVSMTFGMHPCPCWIGLVSKKYNKGGDGRFEMQRDLCLASTSIAERLKHLWFQISFS